MSQQSLDRLRAELLELEWHLGRAGAALIEAESTADPADLKYLLGAFGIRYKSQKDWLLSCGAVRRGFLAHDLAHQSRSADL
jgi:hypothetical protein